MDMFLSWGLEEQAPEQGSELPTTVKSEEELAKFTVDEYLSDTERTVLFLNGGQIIQQRHALANLPAVIRSRGRQGWDAVSAALKSALNRLDTDYQMEAAEVFAYIAKERLMSPADLQSCLLPIIIRNINKEKSEEETETWLHALFELIPMLDKEAMRSEVLAMALSKGDMEDSAKSRVLCARILGQLALYMTKEEVENSFFRRAVKMCQDVDHVVRRFSCQQLSAIGRTAGKDAVCKTVLEEVHELLKDEDLQVRIAAFTCLIQLLDVIPVETRKARVLPVLREHAQPFDQDPAQQKCVAKHFAQMISVIKGELSQDDMHLFYGCYRHLSARPDVELRRHCAQQIGSVVKAAVSVHPPAYMQHFAETFTGFATDQDEEVRLAAAQQFHEVTRVAGKDQVCRLMTRPLCLFLRDDSKQVQSAILQHLPTALNFFTADPSPGKSGSLDEICRALVDLDASSNRNWRLQQSLASCFPYFHQIFSSDQIQNHFLPIALRLLSNSAAATRPVVAEGVACFLRYNKKDRQRAELFLQLIREYGRGKSCSQRMAFADVCKHMVSRFSSKFIKEWVFDLCLELLYDPVPNVRLQVTRILPQLKQAVKLPEDVDLLERLNNAISNSMTDNDRDVSQIARQINDTYKRLPIRMGGGSGSIIDSTGGAIAMYEAEDKKKEAEEAECGFAPEDVKEIKAEIVQMSYKKKSGQPEKESGPQPGVKGAGLNRRTDNGVKVPGSTGNGRTGASGPLLAGARTATGAGGPGSSGNSPSKLNGMLSGGVSTPSGLASRTTAAGSGATPAGRSAMSSGGSITSSVAARKLDTNPIRSVGSVGVPKPSPAAGALKPTMSASSAAAVSRTSPTTLLSKATPAGAVAGRTGSITSTPAIKRK